ncbi:MAG: phosphatase PAP2 family protein [Fuerstiella sp.]|nr:phosphatase PAP2 family protein [Fuerstiella sp.]
MWNRDLKLKALLISVTGCAAFALLIRHRMRFDFYSAGTVLGTVVLLLPFAVSFEGRDLRHFSNLLTGFLCMVVFNLFLTILTYAGTPLNAPLTDSLLMQYDAALGIHLPSIVDWFQQHPTLNRFFHLIYYSVLPSTLLALIVLGLDADVRRLREFVMHYMLAGLITTLIYFVMPAEAPAQTFGYGQTAAQLSFIEHFHALRSGHFSVVSMNNLEGLVTFPSFHTTWALLIAYSLRHYRRLFGPMLLLNAGVAISTVTTGWHYGIDVIGGLLVAALAVMITRAASTWLHADAAKPHCLLLRGAEPAVVE